MYLLIENELLNLNEFQRIKFKDETFDIKFYDKKQSSPVVKFKFIEDNYKETKTKILASMGNAGLMKRI